MDAIKTIDSIREIRDKLYEVESVQTILKDLKKNSIKRIQSNTNKNLPFLTNLEEGNKLKINNEIKHIEELSKQILYKDSTTEYLKSLAEYLASLKVNLIQLDEYQISRLLKKFLQDENINLKQLTMEVKEFEYLIYNLKEKYYSISSHIGKVVGLKEAIAIEEYGHNDHIKRLIEVADLQKQLLFNIGQMFINITKELLKKEVKIDFI